MLDYKSIIIKRYALGLSYKELAEEFSASKSGINDFIRAFERCEKLSYPLSEGITNYAIYELVYGHEPGTNRGNAGYEQPDFAAIFRQMNERKNMTLVYLWSRYQKDCTAREVKPYQYRQFCELYARWCSENYETLHIQAVIAQKMEVDFAGKVFELIDKLTGEITTIVVCDNCKQAVTANKDWINPDLNKDYAARADHNHTVILPTKVRKPKWKSSVENAVGILEKGFFHDLEENRYFSLEQFNRDLWSKLDALNHENFKKKNYSRYDQWMEERQELLPLPAVPYEYMERRTAKVSADFHVRFDNAYYSVDKAYLHKSVMIAASATTVNIYSMKGELIVSWRRASRRGEWLTDPAHLPESYKQMSEWNATYFTRKAMTVGPNTVKVIEHILRSREHEVQTYCLCIGVLNYTKKYSKLALEDCCKLAIDTNHISYSFIKNSIVAVAEEIGSAGFNTKLNEERNKGAFVMSPHTGDIDRLLSKSSKLAGEVRDEEA